MLIQNASIHIYGFFSFIVEQFIYFLYLNNNILQLSISQPFVMRKEGKSLLLKKKTFINFFFKTE